MNKILVNRKRTCFIVLLLTVLVCVAICITLQERNTAFAASADVKTEEYSSLDSDYITGYEGLTIRDYPNKLHATKAAVSSKDMSLRDYSMINWEERYGENGEVIADCGTSSINKRVKTKPFTLIGENVAYSDTLMHDFDRWIIEKCEWRKGCNISV